MPHKKCASRAPHNLEQAENINNRICEELMLLDTQFYAHEQIRNR